MRIRVTVRVRVKARVKVRVRVRVRVSAGHLDYDRANHDVRPVDADLSSILISRSNATFVSTLMSTSASAAICTSIAIAIAIATTTVAGGGLEAFSASLRWYVQP